MANYSTFSALIPPQRPLKVARVLHHLCCGQSFNRFEAERALGDHTLNSTISCLANDHGIGVGRVWETVPGYSGNPTRCARYSIIAEPENLAACHRLLRSWGWRDPLYPSPPQAA